jgi:hypothetical protein
MDKTVEGLNLFRDSNDVVLTNLPVPEQVRITPFLLHLERLKYVKNHGSEEDSLPWESVLTYSGIQARDKQFNR